jgi:hypothetical protein
MRCHHLRIGGLWLSPNFPDGRRVGNPWKDLHLLLPHGRLVCLVLRAIPDHLRSHRGHSKKATSSSGSRRVATAAPAVRRPNFKHRFISSLRIAAMLTRLLPSPTLRETSPATRQDRRRREVISGSSRTKHSLSSRGVGKRVVGGKGAGTTATTTGRATAPTSPGGVQVSRRTATRLGARVIGDSGC